MEEPARKQYDSNWNIRIRSEVSGVSLCEREKKKDYEA